MAYRPPSKVLAEGPSVVHSIDKILSFRDTWREPLANFSFETLMNARLLAAQAAAEKLNKEVAPLVHSQDGFHVIDKNKLSDQEKMIRDAQRALNQLADENFDAVVSPLLQSALFETEISKQVVERIFEKCIEEPKFAYLYARMCREFCEYEHKYLSGAGFRKCLVSKVQTLFEEEPVRLEKKFSEDDMSSARKRKIANTQLVAQLLLCGVLARKVYSFILDAIFLQQQHPQEINVEVGAQLIEICCCAAPEDFDLVAIKKEGLDPINPFQRDKILIPVLTRISGLAPEDHFCKRVQFKLLEILDMSTRGWTIRPGIAAAKARAAKGDDAGVPQTPMTSDTPSSSVGTPLFPKTVASIPKRLPKISGGERKTFVQALSVAIPNGDKVAFSKIITDISTVLSKNTVPVNHMAALSCFIDSVAKSSDVSKHDDAVQLLAHNTWDATVVTMAFQWTVIEGVRESIREDCPKYFDRLATIFANAVILKRQTPFITLVRDLFVPVAERIGEAIEKEAEELDGEMAAEEFVHAWEAFLKTTYKLAKDQKPEDIPKFSECAEWWSKISFKGPMKEIALPEIMGSFSTSGFVDDSEMREWVDANQKNKQAAALVEACAMLC
jgi:hypothetical protein